jgi:hypothetical protein
MFNEDSMIKSKCVGLSVVTLISVVLSGCGGSNFPKTYKVNGTVVQGGKPVDGALVTFLSTEGGKSAIGSTNAKGEFKLSTFGPSDGALPGSYKVTITKTSGPPPAASPALQPGVIASGDIAADYAPPSSNVGAASSGGTPKNALPAKYASDSTSGLIATVMENDNNKFDFDL